MKEAKDPEIKLFGRKIVLPETDESNGGSHCDRSSELSIDGGGEKDEEKQLQPEEVQMTEFSDGKDQNPDDAEESQNPSIESQPDGNPKKNRSNSDEDGVPGNHTDAGNGQQKALKKPDKILPCPRCNSMETKFCYYNNYNVNQPRHFCKSCQRYWTAGGTMRNVPVGAGRRKNKNSASHCHHITISEALQATRIDAPTGFHQPNNSVLSFGPNSLCVSDKRAPNGHYESDHGDTVPCKNGGDDSKSTTDGGKIGVQNIPIIPGATWPIPWNSGVALPAIYPIPVFPAPYWNCSLANAWNVPWLSMPSPTANQNSPLGKHSRNGKLLNPSCSEPEQQHTKAKNSESIIVVPKTLRIDDPEEAAKSSIWETLGIKYDSTTREGLFKALQPKKLAGSPSPLLQANPAALTRSINFHEGA